MGMWGDMCQSVLAPSPATGKLAETARFPVAGDRANCYSRLSQAEQPYSQRELP